MEASRIIQAGAITLSQRTQYRFLLLSIVRRTHRGLGEIETIGKKLLGKANAQGHTSDTERMMSTARCLTVWAITLLSLVSCSSTPEDDGGKPYIARVLEARREAGRARQRADRLEVARYRDAHQQYREAKNSEAVGEEFQTAGQFAESLRAFERADAFYQRAEQLAMKSARADITALRQVVGDLDVRAQEHRASELLPAAYATTRELVATADAAVENGDFGSALRAYEKAKGQLEALEQQTIAKLRESAVQRRDLVVSLQQNVRELHGDVHAPEDYRNGSELLARAQEHLAAEQYFEAQEGLEEARESLNHALGTAREALAREMKIAEQRRQKALERHQAADSAFASEVARSTFEEAMTFLTAGDGLFEQRRYEEAGERFDRALELFDASYGQAMELQKTMQQAAIQTATARSEADKIRASELSAEAYATGVSHEREAAAHLKEHRLVEARQDYSDAATAFEQATGSTLEAMRSMASHEESQRLKVLADDVLTRVEQARRSAEKFQPRDGHGATFGQGEVALQEGQQFYLDEDFSKSKERFQAAIELFGQAADEAREDVRRELGRLRAECESLKSELQGRGVVLGEDYVSAVEALTKAQTHDELNELIDARSQYVQAKQLFGRSASALGSATPVAAAPVDRSVPGTGGTGSSARLGSEIPPRKRSVADSRQPAPRESDSTRSRKLLLGGAIIGLLIGAAVLLLLARPKVRRPHHRLPPTPSDPGRRRSPTVGPRSSVNTRPGLHQRQDAGFPTLTQSGRAD